MSKRLRIGSNSDGVANTVVKKNSGKGLVLKTGGSKVESAIVAAKLDTKEKASLERHERTIAHGLSCFQEVGAALMAIRDGRLYREQFKTFEAYLENKWGIGRAHAYRLIEARKIVATLSPQGDNKTVVLPTQEAVVRPLVGYKPEDQQAAWTAVVAKAGDGPVTAKLVKAEMANYVPTNLRKNRAKAPVKHSGGRANRRRLDSENLKKALGLVDEINKLVKGSGDPKTILNLVNEVHSTLMTIIKGC